MRLRTAIRTAVVGAASVALVGATAVAAGPASAAPGGELRVFTLEPASLVPPEADDLASALVARQLYRGLVGYDLDGSPVLELAQAIESEDNQLWTVTIRPGLTFHNGEPVDAAAFIRGWNHALSGPHAHLVAPIVHLDVVDPLTFEVELAEPFGGFPAQLGHPAFAPLAEACLDDLAACRVAPIGNGPYLIAGAWQPGIGAVLERNPDYPDPGQAQPDSISYQVYPDLAAGCQAFLDGELDVLHPIPDACRPGPIIIVPPEGYFTEDSNTVNYLGLPSYLPELANPLVRQALSLAIDWQRIVATVFAGRHTLADGLAGPHVAGWRPGVCQDCRYEPEEAQQLLEQAGGWTGGELALWAPAGSGHESWLELVGQQLEENLGINFRLEVDLELPDYLALAAAGGFTGPFWQGWAPDYPVLDAYLSPQFRTGAAANYPFYTNEEVDEVLTAGDEALAQPEAIELYQQAETVILEELPVIPMWYDRSEAVHSTQVDEFVWNLFTGPEYGLTTLHQP